ncbi:LuxR family transcriptional regulator [Nocardiopsis terrae]|uniref:Sugar-specific transcriptional regulator TrmB/DNA-binding CsgD family transcriptional regulator n=1 Tax=Nocardiopsis terrae TaxID=372655 RepID=A0ABR9HP11_9ACTN|nr:hypothetical protein [Nocardiopsis terrae]MBE1460767.1 sugar-specific transcriptional regulator TrmB/DNA-binding CsgD family transcriptional regulator [Nocardiopsis terrae]GHC73363.1 LuxR family transcriptional regulator [Nocardiopsis terrae]
MLDDRDDVGMDTPIVPVYELCLECGHYDEELLVKRLPVGVGELRRARDELLGLGLLRGTGSDESPLLPVSPEAAEASVVETRLQILTDRRNDLVRVRDQIRAFRSTHQNFLEAHRAISNGVLNVEDPEEVKTIVRSASRSCRKEVLTMQPGGGRPPATIAEVREDDISLARRGVRVRVLYQHSATSHLATQAYVRSLTEVGGQVRTSPQLFGRMFIFDSELAVVAHPRRDDCPPGAMVLTESRLVDFLRSVYEYVWEGAESFLPSSSRETSDGLTEIHRTVCLLLDQGHTDEVVGKKLGMSVRTVRRYVAEIVSTLGSSSRFQAGAEAVRQGVINERSERTEVQAPDGRNTTWPFTGADGSERGIWT